MPDLETKDKATKGIHHWYIRNYKWLCLNTLVYRWGGVGVPQW